MKAAGWFKKEAKSEPHRALARLKISVIATPIYLISQIALYLIFRNSLYENAVWVIGGPMLITLVLVLPYLYTKRNDRNYSIYYISHPTFFIKVVILIAIPLLIWLFLFAQCKEYIVSIGVECIQKIISGGY